MEEVRAQAIVLDGTSSAYQQCLVDPEGVLLVSGRGRLQEGLDVTRHLLQLWQQYLRNALSNRGTNRQKTSA